MCTFLLHSDQQIFIIGDWIIVGHFVQMTHDMIPDEIIGGLLQPVDELIENITSSVKAR
jgi:hypothetical protein